MGGISEIWFNFDIDTLYFDWDTCDGFFQGAFLPDDFGTDANRMQLLAFTDMRDADRSVDMNEWEAPVTCCEALVRGLRTLKLDGRFGVETYPLFLVE
jgi:hypothetical protein